MGLFGDEGLAASVGTKSAATPLQPGESNTIQRLASTKEDYEFVVHPGELSQFGSWRFFFFFLHLVSHSLNASLRSPPFLLRFCR